MASMRFAPIMTDTMVVAPDYSRLCELVAEKIAALVQAKPNAALGLATGATPLGVYQHLVRLHQNHSLDFSHVTCFNLDEYFPLAADSPHSYHHFMQQNLFQHINCPNWFVPEGRERSPAQIAQDCREYEARISDAGGIDLQLLGIGRTGHIGFNEPGSLPDSRTRLVNLASETRADAASSFGGLENVPMQAVSMGIGTILEAREIVLMASGAGKAEIVRSAWTSDVSLELPATWVRRHPNARLCLDVDAASLL